MKLSEISLSSALDRKELLSQLAYPSGDLRYAASVARILERLGVISLFIVEDDRLLTLGKGFRSIVIACRSRLGEAAAKIRRADYAVRDASREAEMLRKANSLGIGPRLYGHEGPVVLMELVRGIDITSWLLSQSYSREEAVGLIVDLLSQCSSLDLAGIEHGELSDATKHVIKTAGGPVIIDFSQARMTSRPSNLTSSMNYLFHGPPAGIIVEKLKLREPSPQKLRSYKHQPSEDRFKEILLSLLEQHGAKDIGRGLDG